MKKATVLNTALWYPNLPHYTSQPEANHFPSRLQFVNKDWYI